MRLHSLLLPGLFLAIAPSLASSQITVSPAIPQSGQTVVFQAPGSCSGYWELDGSGGLGGASGYAGSTFSVAIPSGDGYAGYYQITLDSGDGSACGYEVTPFAITQPGLSVPTGLSGYYTFLCRGRLPANQGGGMSAAAGGFVADGAGKLSGIFDYNSTTQTLLAQSLAGTYSLDSTGTGQLTAQTPIGTLHYAVIVNPVEIASSAALAATMIEQDAAGDESSHCSVSLVTQSQYVSQGVFGGVAQGWGLVLQLSGESECSGACHLPREYSGNALLALNGDQTASSVSNLAGAASGTKTLQLTGQYTVDTKTARNTLLLSMPGEPPSTPTHFVMYPADQYEHSIYLLSIDPYSKFDLLTGRAPNSGWGAF